MGDPQVRLTTGDRVATVERHAKWGPRKWQVVGLVRGTAYTVQHAWTFGRAFDKANRHVNDTDHCNCSDCLRVRAELDLL